MKCYCGAPAARRAAKRSPIFIWERKGNPWVDFLMVIMASGITCGRVRTTTATESHNMAAILQIIGWPRHAALFSMYFSDIGHLCYDQLTPVKTRYLLTSITWLYCALKLTAHRGHVFFEVDRWPKSGFFFLIGLQAHVRLTCWKQGRIVLKPE